MAINQNYVNEFKTKYPDVTDEIAQAKVAEGWTPTLQSVVAPTAPVAPAPVKPTAPITPVVRGASGDPTIDAYYSGLDQTPMTEDEQAATREKVREQYQQQIDAISAVYSDIFAKEELAGQGREAQGRSVSVRSGLAGSDFATANKERVVSGNKAIMSSLQNEKEAKLASIWSKIDEETTRRIENEKNTALSNQRDYMAQRQTNLDKQEKTAKEAVANLARNGQTWENIDPADKDNIKNLTGLDDVNLKFFWDANVPQSEKTEWQFAWKGDTMVKYGVDPTTGKMVTETFTADDLGIPQEEKPVDPKFQTNENTGITYWYDGANPEVDANGNLVMKPIGKFKKVTGVGNGLNTEEKQMWSEVEKLRNDLSAGKIAWGQAYNTLKQKFGAPDEFIDSQLNKEKWSQTGAYEKQLNERKQAITLTDAADEELSKAINAKILERLNQ